MGFIEEILNGIRIPKVIKIEQTFNQECVDNVEAEVRRQVSGLKGYEKIRPGMSIAITSGSRGVDEYLKITKTVCDMVKEKGAFPFLFPAMGSHGGATAEGQIHVMEEINGITEETAGVPIKSSMEVVEIGHISDGRPVFVDRYAHEADGIILINRIKAHTSFKGPYESGLMKMMAIGIGKQHGAQTYHKTGFGEMPKIVQEAGSTVLEKENILFAIGTVENGYGKARMVACLDKEEIPERERLLLKQSYESLATNFWKQCDALIVKEMGKDIAGTGLDPNVTGRFNTDFYHNDIHVNKIGILELTKSSGGNAAGVGFGDVISRRLYNEIDFDTMYPNVLTSTVIKTANIPMVLDNDRLVVQAVLKTANVLDDTKIRFCIIKNTKDMKHIYISENMAEEAITKGAVILGAPEEVKFDREGNLAMDF